MFETQIEIIEYYKNLILNIIGLVFNFVNEFTELKEDYFINNISFNNSKKYINSFNGYIMEKYDLETIKK